MLGFPRLIQQAGWLPVMVSVTLVYLSASFCGSFLSHAIAGIEGNDRYQRNIDFSSAFHIIAGDFWYVLAETLFLIACAVQACAGIVEASQSLDGFIASFLFGHTYGLQLFPTLEVVNWSPENCVTDGDGLGGLDATEGEDCVPFSEAGPLIITAGFVAVTLLFLPMGTGNLKDAMPFQIISFVFLMVLLVQVSGDTDFLLFHITMPILHPL